MTVGCVTLSNLRTSSSSMWTGVTELLHPFSLQPDQHLLELAPLQMSTVSELMSELIQDEPVQPCKMAELADVALFKDSTKVSRGVRHVDTGCH